MSAIIPDTLVIDTTCVNAFRTEYVYRQTAETVQTDSGLWQAFQRLWFNTLSRILQMIWGWHIPSWVWVLTGAALLLLILLFIYIKKPRLFFRNKAVETQQALHGETIYGIDFDNEIAMSLQNGDFTSMAKWIYLQTLKLLSDEKRIVWLPQKTVRQYTNEIRQSDFNELTAHFIRIRYGNYTANEAVCKQMQALQAAVMKGGDK